MRTKCPVCGDPGPHLEFFQASSVPVHCHILSTSADEARAVPRGDIRLAFCGVCGLIYNAAFDAGLTGYSGAYENSLHFSDRFQEYASALAEDLVRRHRLEGKVVVEIGSGRGDFLSLLVDAGMRQAVGFDPSLRSYPAPPASDGIHIIPDYYPSEAWRGKADLVCCRHTLEHIEEPRLLLETIRSGAVTDRSVLYFEVPHVMYSLRDRGVWDIIYEHCLYFGEPSLVRLFRDAGFVESDVRASFGGQFLSIEASIETESVAREPRDLSERVEELRMRAAIFERSYSDAVSKWSDRVEGWIDEGRAVALWGAGSKGVSFLNAVPGAEHIKYVVDINPRKTGKHIAGSGHKIVGPEWLARNRDCDIVLVMNELYKGEIRKAVQAAGVECEVVVVDVPRGSPSRMSR